MIKKIVVVLLFVASFAALGAADKAPVYAAQCPRPHQECTTKCQYNPLTKQNVCTTTCVNKCF